jgi:hypothetical protein
MVRTTRPRSARSSFGHHVLVVAGLLVLALPGCSAGHVQSKASAHTKPTAAGQRPLNGLGCPEMSPTQAASAATSPGASPTMECDLASLVARMCLFPGPVVPEVPNIQAGHQYVRWHPADAPNSQDSAVSDQSLDSGSMNASCYNIGQRTVSLSRNDLLPVLTGLCVLGGTEPTELPEDYIAKVDCGN